MKTSLCLKTIMTQSALEIVSHEFSRPQFSSLRTGRLALCIFLLIAMNSMAASAADEEKIVAGLDTQYQTAVEKNDAATMDRILADDFVLVTGSGKIQTKADLLKEAQSGQILYKRQSDSLQTVRVWGDTAVVTAKLYAKGTENGKPFEYTLWFSDTYVRTPLGWRYVFGQASLPLPKTP